MNTNTGTPVPPSGTRRRRGGRPAPRAAVATALLAGAVLFAGAAFGAGPAQAATPAASAAAGAAEPPFVYGDSPVGNLDDVGIAPPSLVDVYPVGPSNALAVSPDGTLIYSANAFHPWINVNFASSTKSSGAIDISDIAVAIAFAPNGKLAYALSPADQTISVLDVTGHALSTAYAITGEGAAVPQDLVLGHAAHRAFVTDSLGGVSVVNLSTGTTLARVQVGASASGEVLSPDASRLYVADQSADGTARIAVVNTSNDKVLAQISLPAGAQPGTLTAAPNGKHVYVADLANAAIDVIATATGKVSGVLAVPNGEQPTAIIADRDDLFIGACPDAVVDFYSFASASFTTQVATQDACPTSFVFGTVPLNV
jgi:DNA-binding beta-propeller fold protein YncE